MLRHRGTTIAAGVIIKVRVCEWVYMVEDNVATDLFLVYRFYEYSQICHFHMLQFHHINNY